MSGDSTSEGAVVVPTGVVADNSSGGGVQPSAAAAAAAAPEETATATATTDAASGDRQPSDSGAGKNKNNFPTNQKRPSVVTLTSAPENNAEIVRKVTLYDNSNVSVNLDVVRSVTRANTEDRSRDKLNLLANELRKLSFFRQLPSQAVWDLARVVRYVNVPQSKDNTCEVFRQSDTGTTVYFIVAGQCEVWRRGVNAMSKGSAEAIAASTTGGRGGRRMSMVGTTVLSMDSNEMRMVPTLTPDEQKIEYGEMLAVLKAPNSFGELAMLRAQRRTATVIARPETELLKVNSSDFERVVLRLGNVLFMPEQVRHNLAKPKEERTEVEVTLVAELLKNLRFFQRLNIDIVKSLCRPLEMRLLRDDEVCFLEGDIGDAFYVVLTGEVALCKHASEPVDGKAVLPEGAKIGKSVGQYHETHGEVIGVLHAGDTFGEKALLSQEQNVRYTSAVASKTTELLMLNKKDFSRYMGGMEDVVFAHEVAAGLLKIPPAERTAQHLEKLGEMLKSNSFFQEQPPKIRREICRVAQFRAVPKDSVVVKQGDVGDSFYVILRGTLSVHLSESAEHMAARMVATNASTRRERRGLSNIAAAFRGKSPDKGDVVRKKALKWRSNAKNQVFAKKVALQIATTQPAAMITQMERRPPTAETSPVAKPATPLVAESGASDKSPTEESKRASTGNRRQPGEGQAMEPTELYGPCQAFLGNGQGFGELALLNGAPRAATVVTQEASELLMIMKSDYDQVMLQEQQRLQNSVISALRSLPTLGDWDRYLIVKLSYIFKDTCLPSHVVVLSQGQMTNDIFVIREGTCRVTVRKDGGESVASRRQDRLKTPRKLSNNAERMGTTASSATPRRISNQKIGNFRPSLASMVEQRMHMSGAVKEAARSSSSGALALEALDANMRRRESEALHPSPSADLDLCVLGPGECFGEHAVLTRSQQPVTVTTSSATVNLLVSNGDEVMSALNTLQMTHNITNRINDASSRLSALEALQEHAVARNEFMKERERSIIQTWELVNAKHSVGGEVGISSKLREGMSPVSTPRTTARKGGGISLRLPALISPRSGPSTTPRHDAPSVVPRAPDVRVPTPWLSELGQDQPGGLVNFWVADTNVKQTPLGGGVGSTSKHDGIHGASLDLMASPRERTRVSSDPDYILQRTYKGEFISPRRQVRRARPPLFSPRMSV